MKISITGVGLELTSAIRDYAEKKLSVLEKKMGKFAENALAALELKKTTGHHKNGIIYRSELRLSWGKEKLVIAPEAEDLYAAIDAMKDEAAHEIASRHDRTRSSARRGGREIKKILRAE